MKVKKVPQRTCVVSHEKCDKKEKESQVYKINGRGKTHRFVKRISAVFTDFPSAFCCFLLAGRKIGMIVNFFSNYAGNPVKWLRKI